MHSSFQIKYSNLKVKEKKLSTLQIAKKKKKKNPRLTKYPYTTKSVLHFLEEKKVNERKKKKKVEREL